MTSRFGSIEGYFCDGLGLDALTIDRLRQAFTEPPGGAGPAPAALP
jgi:hypothetical protein